MLQVKLNGETNEIEVRFNYNQDYINRIKQIGGTAFKAEEKVWTVPHLMFEAFEEKFKGEIMFMTPRWLITGDMPPDYSKIYNQVSNIDVPLKPPYKPYSFQSFGANFLSSMALKYGMSCLFDDMGTGKTIQSILGGLILNTIDQYDNMTIPTLVVCKSALKYQWVTDGVNKFTDYTSIVIDGTKKKRMKQYMEIMNNPAKYRYVVLGYETIREDSDILKDIDIGLVIFDESHKIRNQDTKVNKECRKLNFKYAFFLTGSPISKEPSQIFGLGIIGNKKYFGTWKEFKKDYVTVVRTAYGTENFYRNLDGLREKIDNIALRRTEKEIELDMPKISSQNIFVEMTKAQQMIDEDLQKRSIEYTNALEELKDAPNTEKTRERKEQIEAAMKGLVALRVGCADTSELFLMSKKASVVKTYGEVAKADNHSSPKMKQLLEQVTEIVDSGHKVVIFTKFETMVQIIKRDLSKITECVEFTGKMSALEKENARVKFKTDSNCHAFIATNAAAEGLNLQEAKYLINFDLDWDIGINDQRNKRIRRLDSQFDKVFVYNYISVGSADEMILKTLEKNQRLFDYLIENNQTQSDQMKLAMANY